MPKGPNGEKRPETIGQPREAAHPHSHGKVLAFNMRRADQFLDRVAADQFLARAASQISQTARRIFAS